MKPLPLLTLLGSLVAVATCLDRVTWCVTSAAEKAKCDALTRAAPVFSCLQRGSIVDCLTAIRAGEADAIALDGGDIYTAGKDDYQLHPIIAEQYDSSEMCYYAVAVAKRGTQFGLHELQGRKSCHTGVGKSAGWNIPIGTLLDMDFIKWSGSDDSSLEGEVGNFFASSCAPGTTDSRLCGLCKGDCSKSSREPYYNYHGALQCLKDSKGDVAFVKHLTVPVEERMDYELLCKNNQRRPLSEFEDCNLARVPSHAVVTRKNNKELDEFIFQSLTAVQNFNLFESASYGDKNLMFKDSTRKLVQLPHEVDHIMYLGPQYVQSLKALERLSVPRIASTNMKWCTVSQSEAEKCDLWGDASIAQDGTEIDCVKGTSVEDCLKKIMHKEADAMAVDGGQVYTAGKCGLVPAMVEQYSSGTFYYAVAVVRADSALTWDTLKGSRSCHTGIGRNAGWNIPMGLIYDKNNNCNFNDFFSSGCAPGADVNSPLCAQCIGNENSMSKCKATDEERYYGYAGAFRCLAEGNGDVAFIKHSIVEENTNGNGPMWAKRLLSSDYKLVCPKSRTSEPISEFESCHLAKVSAHAVVTRPEIRSQVVSFLTNQQANFGINSPEGSFKMFESNHGKNLLFKDSTKGLQTIPENQDYQSFLGPMYLKSVKKLRECSDTTSDLEKLCSYTLCGNKN